MFLYSKEMQDGKVLRIKESKEIKLKNIKKISAQFLAQPSFQRDVKKIEAQTKKNVYRFKVSCSCNTKCSGKLIRFQKLFLYGETFTNSKIQKLLTQGKHMYLPGLSKVLCRVLQRGDLGEIGRLHQHSIECFFVQFRGRPIGVTANIMYLSINASQRLGICEAAFDGLFDQTAFTKLMVTDLKTQSLGKYFFQ